MRARPTGILVLLGALAASGGGARATPPPIMHPATAAPVPPAVVVLHGLDGQTLSLTAADLARRPQTHLNLTHMGRTSDYAGPELADLLEAVDAPLGPRLRGPAAAVAVLVSAADDYRVVLSLGEVDPALRPGARVILAEAEDGHALPPGEAPARLVIEGDSRPVRDVHSVVSIELRRLR